MTLVPRDWQQRAVDGDRSKRKRNPSNKIYSIEAYFGTGKSYVCAMLANEYLESQEMDTNHVIVLTPWRSVVEGIARTLGKEFGIKTRTRFGYGNAKKDQKYMPPPAYEATVTTYQEVAKEETIEILREWIRKYDFRFSLFCDEVHHLANHLAWGEYVGQIAELAERIVPVSGTVFRTDNTLMSFVSHSNGEYHPDFKYRYPAAVSDGVVRRVACRFVGGPVTLVDAEKKTSYTKELIDIRNGEELREAKLLCLNPNGEIIRRLIQDSTDTLSRTRYKHPNAAALFIAPSGRNDADDDRRIHLLAKTITSITGTRPVVVTHKDNNAVGKIEKFRKSDDPYLVAIDMISEGVDIPRIRSIVWCRYTETRLVFQQVLGRAIRVTSKDDTDAATIYIPDFYEMHKLGVEFMKEGDAGWRSRPPCKVCGQIVCVCPCRDCKKPKRMCICPRCPSCGYKITQCRCGIPWQIFGIDAGVEDKGGQYQTSGVSESFIKEATKLQINHPEHQGPSPVQLGHALQVFVAAAGMSLNPSVDSPISYEDEREGLCRRMNRLCRRLAILAYDRDYGECWRTEVFRKEHVSTLDEIRHTFETDRINQICDGIEAAITLCVTGGSNQ